MKIFSSHLISMIIFAFIASTVLNTIKYDNFQNICKATTILFLKMVLSVIAISWLIYLI